IILFSPPTPAAATQPSTIAAEHAQGLQSYTVDISAAPPPVQLDLEGAGGDSTEIEPIVKDVTEAFDWSHGSQHEFIELEQKVLARKATDDEVSRYQLLKRSRDSQIFAEKYLRDYREIQRLRILSEKLQEIQQYLRPIQAK